MTMEITLAPLPYFWSRQATFEFYARIAESAVDRVYLGETVCPRRQELKIADWLAVAEMLREAGKTVILSTYTLIESPSQIKWLRKLSESGWPIEANDLTTVSLLEEAGVVGWTAGPQLNVYHATTLREYAAMGATRWIPHHELSRDDIKRLVPHAQALSLACEVTVWGPLALAHSSRCFTARRYGRPKDDCGFLCQQWPEGLLIETREGAQFLRMNGVQTQSAKWWSLLDRLEELSSWANAVRIIPNLNDTEGVIAAVAAWREHREPPAPTWVAPERCCNGYWFGRAGYEWVSE